MTNQVLMDNGTVAQGIVVINRTGRNPFEAGEGAAIQVQTRNCVSQQSIVCPISTAVTLASLLTPARIPTGAVCCEIQTDASNGAIRIGLVAGQLATVLTGIRLDDGLTKNIDTSLAGVSVMSNGAATARAQVTFYDRV